MIVKRARGHRIYTQQNERILDLSMDFGRAVIGHRPNGLSLTIKNTIDRGVYAPYGNKFNKRLVNDLKKRFPDHPYITILSYEEKAGIDKSTIIDPLFELKKGEVGYWRPFLDTPDTDILIVLYPLPGLNQTTLIVSKNKLDLESDDISPVLLSGILRSLYDYDMVKKNFKPELYSKFKEIKNSTIKAPYILFNYDNEEYKELCCSALKEGVLLNIRNQINILPPDYSDGEIKKLFKVLN